MNKNSTAGQKPAQVDLAKARNFSFGKSQVTLTFRDAILYSLGIGIGKDPLHRPDLNFVYELSDSFTVFPTMAAVLSDSSKLFEMLVECPGLPEFNPMMLLHGEQGLTVFRPLKEGTTYFTQTVLEDVLDKEKGALVVIKNSAFEDKEMTKLAFVNETGLFVRGIGGFAPQKKPEGGSGGAPLSVPKTQPDFTLEHRTDPNQALVYRLSGDYNPLHVDQDMASMGGFEKPILHGLCFYGITARLILRHLVGADVQQFKSMRARFVGHVFPGETLEVRGWLRPGGSEVVFETRTKERGKPVAVGVLSVKQVPKPKL